MVVIMTRANDKPTWLDEIEIVGGNIALDFVNTVHSYTAPVRHDYLQSPAHLLDWCQHMQLVNDDQSEFLTQLSGSDRRGLLEAARRLRTTLHAVFTGHVTNQPNERALARLNKYLQALARYRSLKAGIDGYTWHYELVPAHPQSMYAPIAFAAAELLNSPESSRLKSCPPPEGCGWFFIDRSRNASRTWCNMKTCGNVVKQRRHRARQHTTGT